MARYVKRGDVWQYEISTKDTTGKYKKIRKSGFASKRLAIIAAAEIELKLSNGFTIGADDVLLVDYFKQWFDLYKRPILSERTISRYGNTILALERYFKGTTLKNLTRTRYQTILNDYAKTHATASVQKLNGHIRAAVKNAIDDGVINRDFTRGAVQKGSVEGKKESEKYLNYTDFKRLMEAASKELDPRFVTRPMIYLGGMTGLRFGELLGLTWDNINFDTLELTVNKSYNYVTKQLNNPKTESSNRTIAIDKQTIKILKEFQTLQRRYFQELSITNGNNLVFYSPSSGVISNNAAGHTIHKLQKQLEITPTISMHGLRHTHASVLLYKGVNILAVSKRLGHKSVDVTLNTYSHVLKEIEAAENSKIRAELNQLLN